MPNLELLLPEAIAAGLATVRFGRRIYHYERIGSTNDVARDLARAGAPEGTVVIAEEQTSGRGRRGRTWLAPPRSCLLVSLIFRPPLPAGEAFRLTMLTAVAAAGAVEKVSGIAPEIKWPNDLLVDGKKLAGILSEAATIEDRLEYAVVGLGLNVNFDPARHPEIAATATSLSTLSGGEVSRVQLLQALLAEIEARYETLVPGMVDVLWQEWQHRLGTLGRQVVVTEGGRSEYGLAEAVAPDGSLLLRRADGSLLTVAVGDVSLRA